MLWLVVVSVGWVSGGFRKVSKRCSEVFWKVSGDTTMGIWRMSGDTPKGIWSQDRSGQVRLCQVMSGQVRSSQDKSS